MFFAPYIRRQDQSVSIVLLDHLKPHLQWWMVEVKFLDRAHDLITSVRQASLQGSSGGHQGHINNLELGAIFLALSSSTDNITVV